MLQILTLRRKIQLQLDLRWVAKTLIAGSATAAAVAALELVKYSKFMLPVYALIGVIVYLVMLRGLRTVNAEDLELLRRFLGRRLALIGRTLGFILLPSD